MYRERDSYICHLKHGLNALYRYMYMYIIRIHIHAHVNYTYAHTYTYMYTYTYTCTLVEVAQIAGFRSSRDTSAYVRCTFSGSERKAFSTPPAVASAPLRPLGKLM